ncbi:hypothetical protein EVAR_67423_1 [Eumeta japonica]|uniref:Uncharacterized protein n=1 Tax=Eumeta variegata TaxID=151549 RepID=A0A4C2A8A4_EUMVA|nr:hypothetical protein EVAR_67423_1 [Eumeta japonica]
MKWNFEFRIFLCGKIILWWTWLQHENGSDGPMKYHTFTEYRCEVTDSGVALHPVSESSSNLITLPQPTLPSILFLSLRAATHCGGARRRRRRRPPTASRLKGPRKQKSFAYKLLKRGLAKSFAYKLLKRGLTNLMSPTSTSGVAPPLQ